MHETSRTEGLLQNRKIKALKWTVYFRAVFLTGYLGAVPFLSKSRLETILTVALLAFTITVEIISIYFLRKRRYVGSIGAAGAVLDAVIVMVMPIIWYFSVGGSAVPASYMLKSPFYITYLFMFLFVNGLAIEPRFVLINMVGGL
jgi:adenylate cyclase